MGLHQGSSLSSFLFAIIMNVLIRRMQDNVPCCMLFDDGIVVIDETRALINTTLKRCRVTLDTNGLRVGRSKTEYLWSNFSNGLNKERIDV